MYTTKQYLPALPHSILKKVPGGGGHSKKNVIFNESLNLFYESNDCLCWLSGDHQHQHEDHYEIEQPTLSPPEGYKDKIFNLNQHYQQLQLEEEEQRQLHQERLQFQQQQYQQQQQNRIARQQQQQYSGGVAEPQLNLANPPPSPPSAKRKVFLYNNATEEEVDQGEEDEQNRRGVRMGGILKGGRLWRSNSSDKKSPEEPDLLKSIETKSVTTNTPPQLPANYAQQQPALPPPPPQKISIGTTPLSTSEQIRLALTLDTRGLKAKSKMKAQQESSLVEKLRWLTSLDDEEGEGDDLYNTWPSRDIRVKKQDATTTTEKTDVEKLNESEMINYIDANRMKVKNLVGDDYGFSHRPNVKGVVVKQRGEGQDGEILQLPLQPPPPPQQQAPPPLQQQLQQPPQQQQQPEQQPPPPPQQNPSEFKSNFQIIRQSFENSSQPVMGVQQQPAHNSQPRPYSWSTLPINHFNQGSYYGTLQPSKSHQQQQQQPGADPATTQAPPANQPIYGTIRRVPNVIGRPLFLHYTALSVEAHPNKIIYPKPPPPPVKLNDTSPVLAATHYYGPPIRYYNNQPTPPTVPNNLSSNNGSSNFNNFNYNIQPQQHSHPHVNVMVSEMLECRGIPEGRDCDGEGPQGGQVSAEFK